MFARVGRTATDLNKHLVVIGGMDANVQVEVACIDGVCIGELVAECNSKIGALDLLRRDAFFNLVQSNGLMFANTFGELHGFYV